MLKLEAFPMFDFCCSHPRFWALLHQAGWRDWQTAEFAIPGASDLTPPVRATD